jgi:hypothetical protein
LSFFCFGSLEAYLVPIFIAIFGPSTMALRVESTILSLIPVCLTWRLASLLAEAAQLPLRRPGEFRLLPAVVTTLDQAYEDTFLCPVYSCRPLLVNR